MIGPHGMPLKAEPLAEAVAARFGAGVPATSAKTMLAGEGEAALCIGALPSAKRSRSSSSSPMSRCRWVRSFDMAFSTTPHTAAPMCELKRRMSATGLVSTSWVRT